MSRPEMGEGSRILEEAFKSSLYREEFVKWLVSSSAISLRDAVQSLGRQTRRLYKPGPKLLGKAKEGVMPSG